MKRILIVAAIAVVTISPSTHAADVGVSVSIGQPGFYGQIDIGDYPQPRVIYRQPRIVEQVQINRPPIYLRVPPGHAKHWSKNCHKYNACGERVYFVQDTWYNREYVPRYQEQHRDRGVERRNERENGRRGNRNEDRQGNNHGQGRDH